MAHRIRCPQCQQINHAGADFCFLCGHDFTEEELITARIPDDPPLVVAPDPPRASSSGTWIGVLIGALAVAGVTWIAFSPSQATNTPNADQIATATAMIERDLKSGLITEANCIGNTAHVTSDLWDGLDAKQKEGLVIAFAWRCEGEHSGNRITVFDSHSGKKLAAFSGGRVEIF